MKKNSKANFAFLKVFFLTSLRSYIPKKEEVLERISFGSSKLVNAFFCVQYLQSLVSTCHLFKCLFFFKITLILLLEALEHF